MLGWKREKQTRGGGVPLFPPNASVPSVCLQRGACPSDSIINMTFLYEQAEGTVASGGNGDLFFHVSIAALDASRYELTKRCPLCSLPVGGLTSPSALFKRQKQATYSSST